MLKTLKRIAQDGEKILIVKPTVGSDYGIGDVFTVDESYEDSVEVNEHNQEVFHSEYEIVEVQ